MPSDLRAPLAAHPEGAAVGGAGGDLEGDRRAAEGRDLDLRAERRLVERDRHVEGEVVALAGEDPVRRDLDRDEQVAGGSAVLAGAALAA